jgi:hypothetical protein
MATTRRWCWSCGLTTCGNMTVVVLGSSARAFGIYDSEGIAPCSTAFKVAFACRRLSLRHVHFTSTSHPLHIHVTSTSHPRHVHFTSTSRPHPLLAFVRLWVCHLPIWGYASGFVGHCPGFGAGQAPIETTTLYVPSLPLPNLGSHPTVKI